MHSGEALVHPSDLLCHTTLYKILSTDVYMQTCVRNVLQYFLTTFSSMPYRKEKRCY